MFGAEEYVDSRIFDVVSSILSILGLTVFGFLLAIYNLFKRNKRNSLSNEKLKERNDLLEETNAYYEKLIEGKNREIERFKSIFPNDERAAHALVHEIFETKTNIRRTTAHGIMYDGTPILILFLTRVQALVAEQYLRFDRDFHCTRFVLAEDFFRTVWSFTPSKGGSISISNEYYDKINGREVDVLLRSMKAITLVYEQAKSNNDRAAQDIIQAGFLILKWLPLFGSEELVQDDNSIFKDALNVSSRLEENIDKFPFSVAIHITYALSNLKVLEDVDRETAEAVYFPKFKRLVNSLENKLPKYLWLYVESCLKNFQKEIQTLG
ncbi:hypothetical protein J7444_08350 [Labrenzia sp. R4_1]|uniref:hypothetical protein n=1 Tax=Labrenzia sp. R4_1 TaxID=2821106 RepID=UPI001ADA59BE|nr:hypothetical protein [Labrenzia sp. R4_1]MBO9424729.1 hypothetical protein [Labrenzia sp. R4_1]